jgi:hypothetical protein
MSKKVKKNHTGVQKYNRILQVLIQNARESDFKYDLKDFQQKASSLYGGFRDKSIKTITAKSVAEAKEVTLKPTQRKYKERVTRINAIDVPNRWFDGEWTFYEIGEWVIDFSQAYPTIPVVIKSAKNELSFIGSIENYSGSIVQDFVEVLRDELKGDYQNTFIGVKAKPKGRRKRQFAFWGTTNAEFPSVIEPIKISDEIKEIVEKREEIIDIKRKLKKLAKKESKKAEKKLLPKIESVKPTLKKITKKESDKTNKDKIKLSELRIKEIEMLKDDLKAGIYTKEEYKAEREKIMNKYEKGGLIK